jgi:hypothetical protein
MDEFARYLETETWHLRFNILGNIMSYPDFYYANDGEVADKSLRSASLDGIMTMRDGSLKKRSYYGDPIQTKDGFTRRYTVLRAVRAA